MHSLHWIVFVSIVLLLACGPSAPPSPIPISAPSTPEDAWAALVERGISKEELGQACDFYRANGWSYTSAWNAVNDERAAVVARMHDEAYGEYKGALTSYLLGTPTPRTMLTKQPASVDEAIESISELYLRTGVVVSDINTVVEEMVFTGKEELGEIVGVTKPLAEWTESDHLAYERRVVERKRVLLEPLCKQGEA